MLFLSLSLHSAAHKVWEFPIIRCLNGADNYTNSAPLAIRFWERNTSFEVEATLAGTWLDKRERREREIDNQCLLFRLKLFRQVFMLAVRILEIIDVRVCFNSELLKRELAILTRHLS